MKKKTWPRIAAAILAGAMVLSLAGCKKGEDENKKNPDPAQTEKIEAPDSYVDNTIDIGDFRPEELIMTDDEAGVVIGNMDEQIYWNGAGFNPKFAANALLTDSSEDAEQNGLPLARFWDRIGGVNLGGKTYAITDLVRNRNDGFQVLEMLVKDFGVDKYDPETGDLVECLGKDLSGDALREAYSERGETDDYTVCAYYLHAEMSGMDAGEYAKAREALENKTRTDHDSILDGTLAVMLYYDTDGYDMYYAIVACAPGYFENAADYEANMNSGLRYDITNCNMLIDGRAVGFLNHVFILCDQDEVPTKTIPSKNYDPSNTSAGRLEDGDMGGADGVESLDD